MDKFVRPMPTTREAADFSDLVYEALTKTNALLPGFDLDYRADLREAISSHVFFQWISSSRKFQNACTYMESKGYFGVFPDSASIKIAHSTVISFLKFHRYTDNPEKLNISGSPEAKKAVRLISALQPLLMGGVGRGVTGNLELITMLAKLKTELTGEAPETISISGKGDVMGFHLVKDTIFCLEMYFDAAPVPVVTNLVSLVYEVSEQNVRRYKRKLSTKPQ